jgi:hypothetical protein
VPGLLKLAHWFWRRGFLNDPPHFYIFVIISPLKRIWPFIWTNLISLHPRIIWTKFDWICSAGSGEDFFFFFKFQCIFTLSLLFTHGEGLNKLESPLSKDDLCQVWLKLAQWFWRRSRKRKSLQTDRQKDGRTDGRRTTCDQRSSLELSAQVS